mmetsp:Transcript_22747/g.71268  ORF Transcript_22747/g.71268 Transcript_22747/m.71268 type:complete len:211 (+) Transcript_22747:562-1194(+)
MWKRLPTSSRVRDLPSSRPNLRVTTAISRWERVLRSRVRRSSRREEASAKSSGPREVVSGMASARRTVLSEEPTPEPFLFWAKTSSSMETTCRSQCLMKSSLAAWSLSLAASSSSVGGRPCSRVRSRVALLRDCIMSWMWTGRRMRRDWSARERMIDWRIHQVAYVENLKPRSGSNFSTARARPNMPSWMMSEKSRPRFWYRFAIEMTSR